MDEDQPTKKLAGAILEGLSFFAVLSQDDDEPH
jgi:hypothetical protein